MDTSMSSSPFTADASSLPEVASFNTPTARLFCNAWCPQLDVFVLVTRIAERNHLVLHAMRDVHVWDFTMPGDTPQPEITAVCWSPDAQIIVVAHGGVRVTLHSVHDGSIYRVLPLREPRPDESKVVNIWWLKHDIKQRPEAFKDVFDRSEVPGSAHSILRLLPPVDTVQRNAAQIKDFTPALSNELIPSLADDHLAASIVVPASDPLSQSSSSSKNEIKSSLLVVGKSSGRLHFYLDGLYSLGSLSCDEGQSCEPIAFHARPQDPSYDPNSDVVPTAMFFIYASKSFDSSRLTTPSAPSEAASGSGTSTPLLKPPKYRRTLRLSNNTPALLQLPLLHAPATRGLAKTSTSVRMLLGYALAVVHEMRDGWVGVTNAHGQVTREGARGLGRKWIGHLQTMQRAHGDAGAGDALLDLTALLLTGRSPHSVREFFSSGGRLTERALTQWEATMTRALAVLHEYSERKLVPACERLVILLEEVQGWGLWHQKYKAYELDPSYIKQTVDELLKVIEYAEWLSKEAELELTRYVEFVRWFRSESLRANDGSANELRPIGFDPLTVLSYLTENFLESPLDKWFRDASDGDQPSVDQEVLALDIPTPSERAIQRPFNSVGAALETAKSYLAKTVPLERQESVWEGSKRQVPSTKNLAGDVDMDAPLDTNVADVDLSRMTELSVTEDDLDFADASRSVQLEGITNRSIVTIIEAIVSRCAHIFGPASGAVVRSAESNLSPIQALGDDPARLDTVFDLLSQDAPEVLASIQRKEPLESTFLIKERLITTTSGEIVQYIATTIPVGAHSSLRDLNAPRSVYFLRIQHASWDALAETTSAASETSSPSSPSFSAPQLSGAVLYCVDGTPDGDVVDVLDLAFFDDDSVVMLVRASMGMAYLVQVPLGGLAMTPMGSTVAPTVEETVAMLREAVFKGTIRAGTFGALNNIRISALTVCRDGSGGALAVNGAARREVACVVDEHGRGQVFDLSRDLEE